MRKIIFSYTTKSVFYGQHEKPIQKTLDYDYLVRKPEPSIVAIVNPNRAGFHKCFFGSKEITIPVFKTVKEAANSNGKADLFVNFASQRSAYSASIEAFEETETLKTHIVVAEGIPENETRHLMKLAEEKEGWIIGPSSVGGIKAGAYATGHAGGTIENIIESKLYRPGSVGMVAVSGGMFNELNNIISKYADGVYESAHVGGDMFTGSSLVDNLIRIGLDPKVKMLVLMSEIGGNAEYDVVEALEKKRINKPLVAWVSGTVAKQFTTEIQFGHAGARSGDDKTSAQAKNKALANAGAYVPTSFAEVGNLIKEVFEKHVKNDDKYAVPNDEDYVLPPKDLKDAIRENIARRPSTIISTISDDRGEEATYNNSPISEYADKSIGNVINALWFKGRLNETGESFIELCLKLTADHGPAVATAHNAIVTARAGKDVVDSLVTGLLTIGERHGGAIDGAAAWAFDSIKRGIDARTLLVESKQSGELIMGIGHKIKTIQNPDNRVALLKNFAAKNLPKTPYLEFALLVEKETLKKKNNLILNVDGTIGAIFLDVLINSSFREEEIKQIIDIGTLNAVFVLGRSIGIIGHVLDQKRLQEGLYRHPIDDIMYLSE